MKKRVYVLLLFVLALANCTNTNTDFPNLHARVQDENISVNATTNFFRNNNSFYVAIMIFNNADHAIELIFDCNDILHYYGKPKETLCMDVYASTLDPQKSYKASIEVPNERIKMGNDNFHVEIKYLLVDDQFSLTVPFKE
ncbi:hypothetical protein GCM10008967_38100 [Bacillus carboniphilus]|uniref:Intracellular proteinase inhibitor BsuPI domain-containing protein n=1 Tax=Bacillus carboniphilus TaxID=86663 RepID=A0ABP3GFA0_9BACI